MLFSIIVPVYNSQDYLYNCLDSLVNQYYTNIEIILVNDGSTDNSLQICEDYAARDERIVVLSQSNRGQAAARNSGVQHCSGDYVLFIDSDDAVTLDLLSLNYEILKSNKADCLQFPVALNYSSKEERVLFDRYEKLFLSSRHTIINSWLTELEISWIVCNKIIKREVAASIAFAEGMIYEDNNYVVDLLDKITSITLSNQGCYHYYQRSNSTTTTKHSLQKELDSIKVLEHVLTTFGDELGKTLYINFVLRVINIEKSVKKNFKKSITKSKKYSSSISLGHLFFLSKLQLKDKIKFLIAKVVF